MGLTQISTAGVKDDAVTASKVPADAVGASELADNAVDTAAIAADAVTGAKIADDAINSEHYTDGSIDTAHIADSQVTTAKIAADAITGAKIADDAIDSEHIVDGSIDTAHIAADQITGAKIADDAIDSEHIADGAVDTAHIADGNVTLVKVAEAAIDEHRLSISNAGSNGQFLSKQSGNTGGLTWAYLPANRNLLINGDMRICQRPASTTSINSYVVDRWRSYGGALDCTISQQTDATAYPRSQKALRLHRTSGTSGTNNTGLCQGVETADSKPYAGETVTLSFKARCGANFSASSNAMTSSINAGEGTDQSCMGMTNTNSGSQANTLSTSVQSFSHSYAVPADKTQLTVSFAYTPTGTAGANDWFEITEVQLEHGSTATPFEFRDFQSEFVRCQRYHQRYRASAQEWVYVEGNAADHKWWGCPFTSMRAQPTVDFSDIDTGSGVTAAASGGATVSSLGLYGLTNTGEVHGRASFRITWSGTWGTAANISHVDQWDGDVVTFTTEL